MAMELVEAMTKQPATCFICNCTPFKGKKPRKAIDLNRDYDWGNNAYICAECGHLIATLLGYKSLDKLRKLEDKVEKLKAEKEELTTKTEEQEKLLSRIRDGSKAVKEARAA